MDYQLNDPKLKQAAQDIAAEFNSKPLQWRLRDEDTLVVILSDGRKIVRRSDEPAPKPKAKPQHKPEAKPNP